EGVVRLLLLPDLLLPVGRHGHDHELAVRQELLRGPRGLARPGRHPATLPAQVGDYRRVRAPHAAGLLAEHQKFLLGDGLGTARSPGDRDPLMPPEQIIAALRFAGMIAFLFFGFPVAFSLIFTGLFFGLLGVGLGYLNANFFDILPLRIWGTMTNFTLLAVPLFVFMGVALEKSGLAEELLETMALLFGKLKGGIAISVVVVGAILAHWKPHLAPPIPAQELAAFRGDAVKRVILALIPAFVLIVGVLGSIFVGIASPTEAASVGAAGGLILTMLKGRFSMAMLRSVMQATTRITSLAFIILVGANCFGLVFRGLNGDHLIQDFLKGLPF